MSAEIMRWFEFEQLPEHVQKYSMPFGKLAAWVEENIPASDERTACLRKLLEAKDAGVRAALPPKNPGE